MKFKSEVQLEALNNATVDTDQFLVSDSSTVKYRTGAQLLSDLGVAGIYVPYTGATGNVDLGSYTLSSYDLIVNHTSGSGVAASITKGGNGEALTINKTSGSGNAMSVTGGLTSLVDLTLSSIANATIDTDRFIVSDSGAIKYRTGAQVLSDIGGQPALTNPITGTGTTNYVAKFTGTTSLGDSQIFDNGTNVGIGTTSPTSKLHVDGNIYSSGYFNSNNIYLGKGSDLFTGGSANDGGLMVSGSNNLIFGNALTERMRITSTGNVGIGTTSPNEKLTVSGKIYANPNKPVVISGQGDPYYGSNITLASDIGSSQGANRIWSRYDGTGSGATTFERSTNSQAYNSDPQLLTYTESMRIGGNGYVGIGTITPVSKLTVAGGDIKVEQSGNTNATISLNPYTGALGTTYQWNLIGGNSGRSYGFQIAEGANTYLHINNSAGGNGGNVGIATTNPVAKLDLYSSDGTVAFKTYTSTTNYTEHSYSKDAGFFIDSYQSVNGSPYTKTTDLVANGDSGAESQMRFFTATTASSPLERMRITSTGNIGIGTTSPIDYQVYGYGANVENRGGRGGGFVSTDSGATNRMVFSVDGSASVGQVKTVTNTPLTFGVNDTERVRITSTGNVGIGTTSPTEKLQVSGNSIITGNLSIGSSSSYGKLNLATTSFGTQTMAFVVADGTQNPRALISYITASGSQRVNFSSSYSTGSTLSNWTFETGNVGIGTTSPSSILETIGQVTINGSATASSVGTLQIKGAKSDTGGLSLTFNNTTNSAGIANYYTGAITFSINSSERMRVDSSGNVGIGTSSPTTKLEVIGSTSNSNGYADGSIQVTGLNPIAFVGPSNLNPSLNRWGFVLREVTDGDFSIRNYRESTTPIIIKNNGNVGIGTTSPLATLHTAGSFLAISGDTFIEVTGTVVNAGNSGDSQMLLEPGVASFGISPAGDFRGVRADVDNGVWFHNESNRQFGLSREKNELFAKENIIQDAQAPGNTTTIVKWIKIYNQDDSSVYFMPLYQ